MTVVALIPARGGSKRIPRKNLEYVGMNSLVGNAITCAVEAGFFNRIVLSTDDVEIAQHATGYFNDLIIFNRPSDLAQDGSPMLPVLKHTVAELTRLHEEPSVVVLLQPTSPFRTAEDVRAAYMLFEEKQADAVVSVTEPEADLVFRVGHSGRMRADPGVVVPNGAIYIIGISALGCGHDWYSGISYAYNMPKERSLDIDTPLDLAMARAAVKHYATA